MFQAKPFVAAAVLGSMGLLVLFAILSSTAPYQAVPFVALQEPDPPRDGRSTTGEDIHLSALDGPAPTAALAHSAMGFPVIVVKVPTAALADSARATGEDTDRWSIPHPDESGMSLLGYNAKSTHLGCTVRLGPGQGWMPGIADGIDPTIALMDPCSQSQFDVLAMGRQRPGMPADRPLGVVPIGLGGDADPVIHGSASLDQARPFDAAEVPVFTFHAQ